jgi:DNA-binding beta-propeller fold protein YncE
MLAALVAVALLIFVGWAGWRLWERFSPPKPFAEVVTLAGAGPKIDARAAQDISDPFGVAADADGNCYVTDGAGGKLFRLDSEGRVSLITDQLDMPSAVAVAPDGSIVVANTGAHTVVRVDAETGRVSVIAGKPGESGDADGAGADAGFNAPVGVAVGKDGTIFVADTYNDRVRRIAPDGSVATLAGGREPGFADGRDAEARFDTPCGVAVDDQGVLVADTGNHRIRRVAFDGNVSTVAGTGEAGERDGQPGEAAFNEPTAIAVTGPGEFYVTDAAASSVRFCKLGGAPAKRPPAPQASDAPGVYTVAGGFPAGLNDGALAGARLNRPTGIALAAKNLLVFADSGNGVLRAFTPQGSELGRRSQPDAARIAASEIRAAVSPRWPFNPPDARREIAGTLGEVRGEVAEGSDAWYHNGFDIPGAYGETVRAIHSERVRLPIAVEGAGGGRERVRFPLLGYIHLRVGRDQNDQPLGMSGVSFRRDEKGKVVGVRLRRGTRVNAGDAIGTLNNLNHVHLIAGPSANEVNALMALELPGLVDTVPPVIEGVRLVTEQGAPLEPSKENRKQALAVSGKLRVVVRAYDQADGNAGHRRLGVFRAGYQLLRADGSPAQGYEEPRFNIVFDRLPADPRTVALVYAEGSQSGYTGRTIFDYVVTNVVRDGGAREDWLDVTTLQPGEYVVRVFVEDYFRNRATRDVKVAVGGR